MSEVHRYQVVTMLSAAGATIGYDPHGPDVVMAAEFDRVTAERDALQALLTAADGRADVLEGLLRDFYLSDSLSVRQMQRVHEVFNPANVALKPAELEPHQGIPGTSFQRLNALANQGE